MFLSVRVEGVEFDVYTCNTVITYGVEKGAQY